MDEYRTTIRDIAEEVGVSTATVSNVLHGKKHKVSQKTIEKVEACLEKKKYIPSMAALLLGRNDSKTVLVVINNHEKYHGHVLEDGFVTASLNSLSKELEDKGLFMMIKVTKKIEDVPIFASMWNMDAVILIGFCDNDYASLRRESRIPFVVYDGWCELKDEEIVMLTVDDRKGGLLAGEYLREMGHKRVICLTDNDWRMDEARYTAVSERVDRADIFMIPIDKNERWKRYEEELDFILSHTASFAISDYYALDFIAFLNSKGFKVPDDISVIGFDGSYEAKSFGLSTISQDHQMRARVAVESLEKFRNKEAQDKQKTIDVSLEKGRTVKRLCD